jgi:hypothetical protein
VAEKIELGAGFAYFGGNTRSKVKTGFHIPEYRLQQDATVKQALGKVNLTHRYMLEERFVHNASKVTLENATTFYLRFRYRVQADYTFGRKKNTI